MFFALVTVWWFIRFLALANGWRFTRFPAIVKHRLAMYTFFPHSLTPAGDLHVFPRLLNTGWRFIRFPRMPTASHFHVFPRLTPVGDDTFSRVITFCSYLFSRASVLTFTFSPNLSWLNMSSKAWHRISSMFCNRASVVYVLGTHI